MEMVEGDVKDLYREGAVIVDMYSARGVLAKLLPMVLRSPSKWAMS